MLDMIHFCPIQCVQDRVLCLSDLFIYCSNCSHFMFQDPNWYKAKNSSGREGTIPANYVQKREGVKTGGKLSLMPWVHGLSCLDQTPTLLLSKQTSRIAFVYSICCLYLPPPNQLWVAFAAMVKIARLRPPPVAVWLLKADALFVRAATLLLCEWKTAAWLGGVVIAERSCLLPPPFFAWTLHSFLSFLCYFRLKRSKKSTPPSTCWGSMCMYLYDWRGHL